MNLIICGKIHKIRKKSDYKQHAKEEITIVENGLIYKNSFYEKITK